MISSLGAVNRRILLLSNFKLNGLNGVEAFDYLENNIQILLVI
jgi:hypothetical protein